MKMLAIHQLTLYIKTTRRDWMDVRALLAYHMLRTTDGYCVGVHLYLVDPGRIRQDCPVFGRLRHNGYLVEEVCVMPIIQGREKVKRVLTSAPNAIFLRS